MDYSVPQSEMFWFTTESGSKYEVDPVHKTMRRMYGEHTPTVNQGLDNSWKMYESITGVIPGLRVMITWGWDGNILRRTQTSPVMEWGDNP